MGSPFPEPMSSHCSSHISKLIGWPRWCHWLLAGLFTGFHSLGLRRADGCPANSHLLFLFKPSTFPSFSFFPFLLSNFTTESTSFNFHLLLYFYLHSSPHTSTSLAVPSMLLPYDLLQLPATFPQSKAMVSCATGESPNFNNFLRWQPLRLLHLEQGFKKAPN